jgi:hypothetical protein
VRLEAAGWRVPDKDFLSGNTKDLDLIATSPDGSVVVDIQVKASTSGDGRIHWQKPGRERVDPWVERAAVLGRQAAVIMIQADDESVRIEPDLHRPGYFIPDPRIVAMTAMTALDAGNLIDARRAEYGTRPRQRLSRGQGVIGELLSPDKLNYPIYVEDGKPLEDFLREIAIPSAIAGLARHQNGPGPG